jgi:hypothetical protein
VALHGSADLAGKRAFVDVIGSKNIKDHFRMSRTLILVVSLTALGVFQETVAQSKSSFEGFKLVDKTGNIRKPDDYRDRY